MSKFTDLLKGETPVLIDFYATWCGPCKTQAPVLDQLKKRAGGSLVILKIDVDKNQQAAAKFKVKSMPTLMLFKNNQCVWRESGVLNLKQLEGKIKNALEN